MPLGSLQIELLEGLRTAVATETSGQFEYCTEWLGYLPYGQYHWIEVAGVDITIRLPSGWQSEDLLELEDSGEIRKLAEWQNPEDPLEVTVTYELTNREHTTAA